MTDISRKLSVGEREILRNQRLIMRALLSVVDRHTSTAEQLINRLVQMDRDWEFIASPEDRVIPYEPKRS